MYSQLTHGIKVEVEPQYVAERSNRERRYYFFAYSVRIENRSSETCQLMRRNWIIRNGNGVEEHISGEGVVGEQPRLEPGKAFAYTSACPLRTPTGSMRGVFEMRDAKGHRFEVAVPVFFLRGHENDVQRLA